MDISNLLVECEIMPPPSLCDIIIVSLPSSHLITSSLDFSFAVNVKGTHSICGDAVGTPGYSAPEVFSGDWYDAKLADVYSM